MIAYLAPVCALLLALTPGSAQAWRIDERRSVISFTYEEDGAPKRGVFRRFGGTLNYDAVDTASSTADLTVATASLALGDFLREGMLEAPEWLDSAAHPRARFTLEKLQASGGGVYTATGTLEIKGIRRPVRFPVTLDDDGIEAHARGDIAFHRDDFRLQDPLLEVIVDIGETVHIDFDIVALREPGDAR